MKLGPWLERLEAIAASRELVAVAGWRDAPGSPASSIHVITPMPDRPTSRSVEAGAAVRALAFAGEATLVSGGDDGRVTAWDAQTLKPRAHVDLGAAVRALAVDAEAARGATGLVAVGTADGALHLVELAFTGGSAKFAARAKHALSAPIGAVCFDPANLVLAGCADGQLWIASTTGGAGAAAPRAVSPGGDGGIRALAAIGDGRAAVGCGDGGLRLCFVVGDVEAQDRSGDHGHDGALRGLVLGPAITDDAGRDQPRRIYSAGEDGAVKAWLVDGARRPKTLELGIGALAAIALQPAPTAASPNACRLWLASVDRKLAAIQLHATPETSGAGAEPVVIGAIDSDLARLAGELADGNAAAKVKVAAVARLETIAEDEARRTLDGALAAGPTEVRVAAAAAIARSNRRASRPALRTALAAQIAEIRTAAFRALLELERDQPLAAIRAGLAAANDDIRQLAVDALVPVARTSVVAAGLIADALRDDLPTPSVRRRAFAALRQIVSPLEAVRIALARGAADIRAQALLVLGFATGDVSQPARALARGALDDADPIVRSSAFLAAIMQQPRLAPVLRQVVPSLAQAFDQVAQQLAVTLNLGPAAPAAELTDDEREPLFAALACRAPDAALRGAGALLALRDSRALGAVLQLTREADPALRRGATANVVAALALWPDDDRLATRLVWLLDDADAEVRAYAFDALATAAKAKYTAAELDLAELALRCSQEDIRVRALQILVRVGSPGQSEHAAADRLLGDALDDEAAKVRGEAFRTLWAWHAADPETPIRRGAASRHGDLRGQVVAEIARRRQAKQSTAELDRQLAGLVGDPVADVALAAFGELTKVPDGAAATAAGAPVSADLALAAMRSPLPQVRAVGALAARRASAAGVRARLVELVRDEQPNVHTAAIETLDAILPADAEGFSLAFASPFWSLQVRATELLGARRDARAVAPAQRILSIPKTDLNRPPDAIRQRAASALADAGDAGALAFLRALIDDPDPIVREMAARGVATAARPGDETARTALVALLGHADLPVRSWAAEGLAKLGDLRALPVLAGTQRHDHRPLRIGAIVGFVALGPDGVRGLRQGLEDPDRDVQDLAFSVIVARDAALADAGIEPDLLGDAMASPSPEIRFAAARLYERRTSGEAIGADVIADFVGPRRTEKAADMKDWPPAARRAALLQVLASAIASDEPAQRYAAAQVLAVRAQPLTFWREAARLTGPARGGAQTPRTGWSPESRTARRSGWLRRLAGGRGERREIGDPDASELEQLAALFVRVGAPVSVDAAAAQRLVFGVYAGLVRQAPRAGDADETHRVRRDAVGRLADLAREDAVGAEAVLPVLDHAIGDPHHLVRQAAMAALRGLYPAGALAPLAMAIGAAADLGKAAIDELVGLAVEGDERAAELVRGAIDADEPAVRAHAALRLARLYPAGSTEPQLVVARSKHGDVRLAAITELANASELTAAIVDALVAALASEHADLRLKAAIALARGGRDAGAAGAGAGAGAAANSAAADALARGIDVLGGFLRSDDHARAALTALIGLADREASAGAAAEAIAARLDDASESADTTADLPALIKALGALHHANGAASLVRVAVASRPGKDTNAEALAGTAFGALLEVLVDRAKKPQLLPDGTRRARYREVLALGALGDVARGPHAGVRARVAAALGDIDDGAVEALLERLLGDRDPAVRTAAAESLAKRAEYVPHATLAALESALRGGRRELVLPAALGLAARKRPEAFQPLLLVVKAGEPPERERALLALGSLGDRRALAELNLLFEAPPDDESARALVPAAIEALGRLLPALDGDDAADAGARLERIALSGNGVERRRALTGLRYAGRLGIVESVAADREARLDIRTHALTELGLARQASSEPVLADLVSDPQLAVAQAALAALERLVGGDRTRASLYALGSPHVEISARAGKYLAASGDAAILVERLGAIDNADVRAMIREGLVRRGELPAAQLEHALCGEDPRPRAEAAWIVGYGGARAATFGDAVAAAVARGDRGWRAADGGARGGAAKLADEAQAWQAALWAASRIGGAGAAGAARAGVVDGAVAVLRDERAPVGVRRAAAELLAAGGAANVIDALAARVADGDREVRAVAAAAVAARAPERAQAVVTGVGARADATTIRPLAAVAWRTLAPAVVGEPGTRAWGLAVALATRSVDELIAIATASGDEVTRIAAIYALGRLGGDAADTALERIHGDKSQSDAIRLAAWKALKRLLGAKNKKKYGDNENQGGPDNAASTSSSGDDDGGGDGDSGDDEDSDDDDSGDDDSGDDDSGSDDDSGDDDDSDDDDEDDDGEDDDDE